ncbi:unnamed protein product [Callosobruchus maculatus]|uniref:DDE Tnp4 domain-containing protein n=1 Tax=Callosobruchus maculatus TaxID=64391 RepID=A0A653BKL8_CALMS|nr:unnamed protein product [Callosobruchus maculatus]
MICNMNNFCSASAFLVIKSIKSDSEDEESSSSESSSDEFCLNDGPIRSNHYFYSIIPEYCDEVFKSHFRINKTTFMTLVQEIGPHYERKSKRRPPIELERVLLFSIWLMANPESFRGVTDRFGLSRGHGHKIFMKIVKIFYKLKDKFIYFPKQRSLLQEVEKFNDLRGVGSFPGVVGCVDGTHIAIPGPWRDNSYYNRKGTHSVLLQAICNSNLEFLDVYCGWPGSAHDARVWANSPIKALLDSDNSPLPTDYHLLGDASYLLSIYLKVPCRDNGALTEQQKKFNKKLSSMRIVIEQACGHLLEGSGD